MAYVVSMSAQPQELPVSQARDHFSEVVNRAVFGGEITYITRGRGRHRAAAIVPAELVERYEELLDEADGRIAARRLADIDQGRARVVSADEASAALDL